VRPYVKPERGPTTKLAGKHKTKTTPLHRCFYCDNKERWFGGLSVGDAIARKWWADGYEPCRYRRWEKKALGEGNS